MTPRLLCHPATHTLPDDLPDRVLALLRARRLLGEPLPLAGETRHLCGPALLEEVTFLGCSPHIELDPPAGESPASAALAGRFCHWRLTPLYPEPRLRLDPQASPRCPACGTSLPSPTLDGAGRLRCPVCGHDSPPEAWRWKQRGACARFFLELVGVHAGEAVPGEALLAGLAELTGGRWDFAFVRD